MMMMMMMCLCLTVTSRYCVETAGRFELVFDLNRIKLQVNSGILKNNGTSRWNFLSSFGLKKMSPRHFGRHNVVLSCSSSSTMLELHYFELL